ncbi:TlpA disulfide reductase family protein [Psychrobium sp. 1_MG-2023]|uniref:TlpA family protein disulfide reductase n=1 Tax=Psychrobium sp. 1_MG-2023 TaxID=3062624 RepID=UPI000C32096A|nr:TlpA disulfide reductase family protein [Psychrobium sp. 1_MG-2023]MDP2562662.1 TlpA disulfide reductase family protein [Psychrobium sp. 1_MG-2023]PKF53809.1 hypothetical protein CW748_17560 [Alteromonadales bacterium alter-6D02]
MKRFNQNVHKASKFRKLAPLIFGGLLGVFSVNLMAKTLDIGDSAPSFSVKTLNGTTVNLSDFKTQKPVYLKFWATWCTYCKVEMPHLQAMYDQYGDDIEILTVNIAMNDSVNNINTFFQQNGLNLPTTFDSDGSLTSAYGVVGTPFHVLIDKQGDIAYRTFLVTDKLDQTIVELAKGAAQ